MFRERPVTTVREYSAPLQVPTEEHENLTRIVLDNAEAGPDKVVYRRQVDGAWIPVTAKQFHDEVVSLAKGLAAAGVQVGDRVALMARTRYEWSLVDFAVWFAGGIVVPIYETSSAEQVEWMARDSGAVACIVENGAHAALVASIRQSLPALRDVWTIEDGDLADVAARGVDVTDEDLLARRNALVGSTVATLIYTSGTTGRPKGCELTHGNFLFEARNAIAVLEDVLAEDGETLLFLPLAHVFARIIEIACIMRPVTLAHSPDVTNAGDRPRRCASRRSSSPCRGCSRRCSTAPASARTRRARQGQDLRRRGADRDRVQQSPRRRGRRPRPAAQARAVRPTRLQQAARGVRRPAHVRNLRRRAAR